MKKVCILLAYMAAFVYGDTGKALFEAKCASCHLSTKPTTEQMKTLVAPAIMGVMRHVKEAYPTHKEATEFIVDYSQEPSREKAICLSDKIARFGLMPSLKGQVSPEELRQIADYLFVNFPPENFRGMGRSKGL